MNGGYVKLYDGILSSSVWAEPAATRIVFITMLALADKEGKVNASPSGLARLANVSLAECRTATETLEGPDLESKSPEWGGRRIEKVEGGWVVLNYLKYRAMQSPTQLANAERQARYRARQAEGVPADEERNGALRNGHKTPTVDVDEAVSVTVPATSKEEGGGVSPVTKLAVFLGKWDFERWHDIVAGYIRASRRPVNIMAHLELHLTGEMGYKLRDPVTIGFVLNQYAAAQSEFVPVLFDGFVRKVKGQLDRNVGAAAIAQEDAHIARERREREEREQDERDQALLADFERVNEAKFEALKVRAEASVDSRYTGDMRMVMVRTELLRLVRKAGQ